MPEPSGPPKEKQRLSTQIEALWREVQELVTQGTEHPLFEFKRELSIKRESLDDRLDFIKLLQGMANSDDRDQRCIVIGADPSKRLFHNVENCAEFDQAAVTSIVEKYLDPSPRFQVFNNLLTADGKSFVLFVLDGAQPRPVVLKTEGARNGGKVRLRVGEIWIKRGTGLFPATRNDLEQMYRERMEEEAEDRARKRLKHLSDISGTALALPHSRSHVPSPELFVGPGPEFRRFVEGMIADEDSSRLGMLVELAREWVVDGWDQVGARTSSGYGTIDADSTIEEFFRDKFIPSLQSIVALGLLIMKYDRTPEWLKAVVDVLQDGFEAARGLQALKSRTSVSQSLPWWRPGLELYIAMKCLGAYAMHRRRYAFLPAVFRRTAMRIELDDRNTQPTPLLFWPLSVYTEFFQSGQVIQGRASFFWQERISTSWGSYFGSFERFISSSCQLEFILELNSYLGTNTLNDKDVAHWLSEQEDDIWWAYNPDLFAYSLSQTIPIAELVRDWLVAGSSLELVSVNPSLMETSFRSRDQNKRLLFLGGFLDHLHSWQAKYSMQHGRFPPMFEWPKTLKELVQQHRSQSKPHPSS